MDLPAIEKSLVLDGAPNHTFLDPYLWRVYNTMTTKEEPPRAISLQGPNFPEMYHGAVTGTTEAQNPSLGEQNL